MSISTLLVKNLKEASKTLKAKGYNVVPTTVRNHKHIVSRIRMGEISKAAIITTNHIKSKIIFKTI